ncbi:MAG TPA: Gfo/Idh/MocA family oxidoreductase [Opitutaceae bacterium]|nr:Gfo/Idh/MocA family oxidoreductase [Opitutaceae bacterium]
MKKRFNVGVVGCGYWGPNLVRNFRSISDCRLKVICDLNEDRLRHIRSLYPEVEAEMDMSRLLNNPDIDAIVVATSVRMHFPMAKACLLAGKHVLIEKPMAASAAECEELIAIAQRQGLVLMVGHTFLYSAEVRKIKEIVDNHDIGELRYISCRRLNLGLFQKDINVAWDLAPHDISIILYIMQEMPQSLNCRGGAHITNGIEDVTSMSLNFTKERSAIIHSSWHDPRKVREMTIVGSKRMIVYDDIPSYEKIKIYDVRIETPPHYDTFAEFRYAYHYGDTYSPYIKQDEPLKAECQHFIDCIKDDLVPLTNGQSGLDVVRILEASSASLKNHGAPVNLWPVVSNRPSSMMGQSYSPHAPTGNGNRNSGATAKNGNGHAGTIVLNGKHGNGSSAQPGKHSNGMKLAPGSVR